MELVKRLGGSKNFRDLVGKGFKVEVLGYRVVGIGVYGIGIEMQSLYNGGSYGKRTCKTKWS